MVWMKHVPGGLNRLQGKNTSESSFHSTGAHVTPVRGIIHVQYTCSPGHTQADGCGTDKTDAGSQLPGREGQRG